MDFISDPRRLPTYQSVCHSFLRAYPEYASTSEIDTLRWSDYPHLDQGHHCFDYTGNGIFSSRFSNQPDFGLAYTSASLATHALYEDEATLEGVLRRRILAHMQLKETEYSIVFAADAFSALKLLVETFPFHNSKRLLLGYDFENESLSRIEQTASERGAKVMHAAVRQPGFELDHESLRRQLQVRKKAKQKSRGVFAYPLVSRVTGTKNSVYWIREARSNGWYVLLDVSSAGANFAQLASLSPDFLVGSFYKVFGMDPTGFGCLVVKRELLTRLDGAFKCGMVKIVSLKRSEDSTGTLFSEGTENGSLSHEPQKLERVAAGVPLEQTHKLVNISSTLSWKKNWLTILSPPRNTYSKITFPGLDHAERSAALFRRRQEPLLTWLRKSFMVLRHAAPGDPQLVRIHSPLDSGPVLAFSLVDSNGDVLDTNLVQRLANRSNISLATGVIRLVNETAFRVECKHSAKCLGKSDVPASERFDVLCATVGFLTSLRDVFQLWEFIAQFLDSSFCSRVLLKYRGLNQETVILSLKLLLQTSSFVHDEHLVLSSEPFVTCKSDVHHHLLYLHAFVSSLFK